MQKIQSICWSPNGKRMALVSADRVVQLYNEHVLSLLFLIQVRKERQVRHEGPRKRPKILHRARHWVLPRLPEDRCGPIRQHRVCLQNWCRVGREEIHLQQVPHQLRSDHHGLAQGPPGHHFWHCWRQGILGCLPSFLFLFFCIGINLRLKWVF